MNPRDQSIFKAARAAIAHGFSSVSQWLRDGPKFGQGALWAAWRQGLKEIGNIIAAFPGHSPLIEEPGQLGRATQQSISRQTGASQPVHFNQSQQESAADMNSAEKTTAQPQNETEHESSIVDQLVQNAEERAAEHEPENEQVQDLEP